VGWVRMFQSQAEAGFAYQGKGSVIIRVELRPARVSRQLGHRGT
jgi:hypothetical protein